MERNHRGRRLLLIALAAALWTASPRQASATVYEVDVVADENDGSCTDGDCSLRDAIIAANTQPGPDSIEFNIAGCDPCVIALALGGLPSLTDDNTTIDGYTQPGAAPADLNTPASLKISLDGSGTTNAYGLHITSANNTITGLVIGGFDYAGVRIDGSGATGNTIAGNYIGTNGKHGVGIFSDASDNTIGGDQPAARNMISANGMNGVNISGMNTLRNVISGNYIGTDPTGTLDAGNTENGVSIRNGAKLTVVGGKGSGLRNVISGNGLCGVALAGAGTNGNTVSANYIGTKAGGTEALANDEDGVCISDGAQSNTVGGDAKGEGNLISGNSSWGVSIRDSGSVDNVVSGNHIGTDAKGASPLPNSGGVSLANETHHNTIGGDAEGERNVISGNTHVGIGITNGRDNVVSGNFIGTDVTGALSLGNGTYGLIMQSASRDNRVGGDLPNERNVISANGQAGIEIRGVDTIGNVVMGNYIGTDVAGSGDLGNAGPGCMFQLDAQYNTLGPGNVIAYNSDGVWVSGNDTYGNIITRNSIFANVIDPIALSLGGNLNIPWPVIDSVFSGPVEIGGTSCPLCTVEVFANSTLHRQAETYVGSDQADAGGSWTITVSHLPKPYLTASATHVFSGTSEINGPWDSGIRTIFLPWVARTP